MYYSGQVDSFTHFHSLTAILVLKNGSIVCTQEPTIDQIFREVANSGDPCKGIAMGTG